MKNTIEWHQAQELPEHNENRRAEKLAEFLDSNCEMMNGRDLQYYVDETGKDLQWIIDNGRDIHPVIKETFYATGSMDDVWDFDPINYTNEDCWEDYEDDDDIDEEEEAYFLDLWKRDGFRVPENKNQIKLEL